MTSADSLRKTIQKRKGPIRTQIELPRLTSLGDAYVLLWNSTFIDLVINIDVRTFRHESIGIQILLAYSDFSLAKISIQPI